MVLFQQRAWSSLISHVMVLFQTHDMWYWNSMPLFGTIPWHVILENSMSLFETIPWHVILEISMPFFETIPWDVILITCHGIVLNKRMEFSNITCHVLFQTREWNSNITCHGIVSYKGLHALVWNNTMTCDIGTPCPCLKQYHDMWYWNSMPLFETIPWHVILENSMSLFETRPWHVTCHGIASTKGVEFSNIACHGLVSNKAMEFQFDVLVWINTVTCDIGPPCPCLKQYHDMWY
jgi:hypothetical protein